jgi:hypothetical protein
MAQMSPSPENWKLVAFFAMAVVFCSASQDIVVDSFRIDSFEDNEQGAGSAVFVLGYRIGMIFSGAFALLLAEHLSWNMVYTIMSCGAWIGIITILLSKEPEKDRSYYEPSAVKLPFFPRLKRFLRRSIVAPFTDFMKHNKWLLILIFILLYRLSDDYKAPMTTVFYDDMGFKVIQMNHSFRQSDPVFADNILKIGLGTATQETLDYFNQKVISWQEYEKTHKKYMYLASTRKEVGTMNDIYLKWVKGKEKTFKTQKSPGFPDNIKEFDEDITLKEGAQVIFTQNNRAAGHVNGSIGIITSLDDMGADVELEDGSHTRAQYSKFDIFEPYIEESTGLIKNRIKAWVWSIDCKICKAMTINKSQGKTFEDAYIALGGWIQQGGLYVALSRLTELDGLGLSRPIKMGDMIVNNESKEFFAKLEKQKTLEENKS